jgi:3-deoxy-D-manno-octulosonate 8-phosphate phosphatase (KDO 8-P phosphatase)
MKAFVIDVDGVLTDGKMHYSKEGKVMKVFGADDHDALNMIRDKINIHFVTADKIGFPISFRRVVDDMGFPLHFVKMQDRAEWIDEKFGLGNTIYMGDGVLDPSVFDKVGYSICPADGFYQTREVADYVTQHSGGDRAVAEACMHIKEKFLV